ncbi:MAG TPA: hypothetical protein VFU76_16415 [Terriglobales bacterium]|nr:hypothetical protein [Terriglobales bacterium]
MFEEELELEKKESSLIPMILIFALVAAIVGTAVYFINQARQKLTPEEATTLVQKILVARGPATTQFDAGLIKPSVDVSPQDPHYRILEKAGIVELAKPAKDGSVKISLTKDGEQQLAAFPELKKRELKDGTIVYTVPLAERTLVKVDNVEMRSPTVAVVTYEWAWKTNKVGDAFDADSDLIKTFKVWDRQKLIDKFGADFYHGPNQKTTVTLVKQDNGWQISNQ